MYFKLVVEFQYIRGYGRRACVRVCVRACIRFAKFTNFTAVKGSAPKRPNSSP
jgi:hypothetical protein